MPIITIEAGTASKETKAELTKVLTDDVVRILNATKDHVFIIYKENNFDNLAIAGELLSDK